MTATIGKPLEEIFTDKSEDELLLEELVRLVESKNKIERKIKKKQKRLRKINGVELKKDQSFLTRIQRRFAAVKRRATR